MRKEYQLSNKQYADIRVASQPVPMIGLHLSGGPPSSQDRADHFWQRLGEELGFDWETVEPIEGKGPNWFSAEGK